MEMKMRYKHDCVHCKPLGVSMEYDLYFCPQKSGIPTVVARYGDEGPDYISGLVHNDNIPRILRIAEFMAKTYGFIYESHSVT